MADFPFLQMKAQLISPQEDEVSRSNPSSELSLFSSMRDFMFYSPSWLDESRKRMDFCSCSSALHVVLVSITQRSKVSCRAAGGHVAHITHYDYQTRTEEADEDVTAPLRLFYIIKMSINVIFSVLSKKKQYIRDKKCQI